MSSQTLSLAAIEEIFSRFKNQTPHPQTELAYTNLYTLLVAVVLSAQATDKGVNKATADLFKIADTPQKMLQLGIEGLKGYIKTIGLYNAKAANIIKLSQLLIERFAGNIPSTREDLESLPGVGRKTANVILNVGFGQPTIAVDTHLFRVSKRIGLTHGQSPLAVEKDLAKGIPLRFQNHAHHWLILHGRYTCQARKPYCWECLIKDLCTFEQKNLIPSSR